MTPEERVREHWDLPKYMARRQATRTGRFTCIDEMSSAGLIGLWQAARQYEGPEEGFRGYAVSIVHHKVIDEFRYWCGRTLERRKPELVANDQSEISDAQVALSYGLAPSAEDVVVDVIVRHENFQWILDTCEHLFETTRKGRKRPSTSSLPACAYTDALLYEVRGERMADLAARYNVSESRISQIRTEAIERMRELAEV